MEIVDGAGASKVLIICYDGNHQTVGVCGVESTLECSGFSYDVVCDIKTWNFNDSLFSYEDFATISYPGTSVCVVGDTAYVRFSLESTDNDEVYQTGWVDTDDDGCGSSMSEVEAWLNETDGMYNSQFYVGDATGNDYYWRGKGKFCSKTALGNCKRFRISLATCGGGKKPPWFKKSPK